LQRCAQRPKGVARARAVAQLRGSTLDPSHAPVRDSGVGQVKPGASEPVIKFVRKSMDAQKSACTAQICTMSVENVCWVYVQNRELLDFNIA